jgi:hypothetical protein
VKRWLATVLIALACLFGIVLAAHAATVPLYPGSGVGGARLGATDTTAVIALKRAFAITRQGRDDNYANQRVYFYYFGKRLAGDHYPVEMYAKRDHHVFLFEVNSPLCATSKGIRVGSTESQLRTAYGSAIRTRTTSSTNPYRMYFSGTTTNRTDYYVRKSDGKIARVLISRY